MLVNYYLISEYLLNSLVSQCRFGIKIWYFSGLNNCCPNTQHCNSRLCLPVGIGEEVVGNVGRVVNEVLSRDGTAVGGSTEHLLAENVMSSTAMSPWDPLPLTPSIITCGRETAVLFISLTGHHRFLSHLGPSHWTLDNYCRVYKMFW